MMILETRIHTVTRNRDFGMIEARVSFLIRDRAGQAPRNMTVLTHCAPGGRNLRHRLLADATRLVAHGLRQPMAPPCGIAA